MSYAAILGLLHNFYFGKNNMIKIFNCTGKKITSYLYLVYDHTTAEGVSFNNGDIALFDEDDFLGIDQMQAQCTCLTVVTLDSTDIDKDPNIDSTLSSLFLEQELI